MYAFGHHVLCLGILHRGYVCDTHRVCYTCSDLKLTPPIGAKKWIKMNHQLHVAISYFIFGYLGTCLLIHLYYLFIKCIELRRLKRNTYNAYMNMVQGMEDYDEEMGIDTTMHQQ